MISISGTIERLKELLHYDPETGIFSYRRQRGRWRPGARAGAKDSKGRIQLIGSRWFPLSVTGS